MMGFPLKLLAGYLGRKASILLGDPPFKDWPVEKSVDTDLRMPKYDYLFAENGMDFVCDHDDKVQTIFVYNDGSRQCTEGIQDIPWASGREAVIALLGPPSRSGAGSRRLLGEYGAWDRFACGSYAIHVEYRPKADIIKMITLMRADVVPA